MAVEPITFEISRLNDRERTALKTAAQELDCPVEFHQTEKGQESCVFLNEDTSLMFGIVKALRGWHVYGHEGRHITTIAKLDDLVKRLVAGNLADD